MIRIVLPIFALFLSLVLLVSGNTMLGTLLAVRLEIEGFRAALSGLVLAFYAVGFVLGTIYGIRVIQRVGHIRAFAAFGAVTCAAILMHPLYVSTDLWMALRLVVGFCVAGLMLITESWVNAIATTQTRGALLGVYLVLFYLAAASGQFMIAAGEPANFPLFSVAAILVALSLLPLLLTRSVAPELHEVERLSMRELYDAAPLGIIGGIVSGAAMSAFTAMGPIYATSVGLEITQLSLFMGIGVLSAMLFQMPVGFLSDRFPRSRVVFGLALAGLAAALLATVAAKTSTIALFLTTGLFVGFIASLYPVCLALTHDQMPHNKIVPANATLLLCFGIGTIVGPIGSAVLMTTIGPSGLFVFAALILLVLAARAAYYLRHQPQLPVTEQEHCVAVPPVSTPVLMELDPRSDTFQDTPETEAAGQRAASG
jgi:MFS family permease